MELAKRFKWLGPGVFPIRHNPGQKPFPVKIIGPGGIIKEAEHLAAIGLERMEHLIEEGKAELVKVVDGIFDAKKPVDGVATPEELERAQVAAQGAQDQGEAAKNLAKGQQKASAAVKPIVAEEPLTEGAPEGAGPK